MAIETGNCEFSMVLSENSTLTVISLEMSLMTA